MKSSRVWARTFGFSTLLSGLVGFGCSGTEFADGELSYCDAEPIIHDKCVRCHSDPPQNGAPFSLETFEDVSKETSGMERVISSGFMPLTSLDLDPPVEPLTHDEEDILLTWLDEGAPSGGCD